MSSQREVASYAVHRMLFSRERTILTMSRVVQGKSEDEGRRKRQSSRRRCTSSVAP